MLLSVDTARRILKGIAFTNMFSIMDCTVEWGDRLSQGVRSGAGTHKFFTLSFSYFFGFFKY